MVAQQGRQLASEKISREKNKKRQILDSWNDCYRCTPSNVTISCPILLTRSARYALKELLKDPKNSTTATTGGSRILNNL